MALSFAREDGVAIDKPAGTACPNLTGARDCAIYPDRAEKGFAVCVRYECFGAGQRVTQDLFGGRSWRNDPSLIRPMMDAFARMRGVHDALVLISEGRKLPLTSDECARLNEIEAELNPTAGWTQHALEAAPVSARAREITALLRGAHMRRTT